VPEKPDLMAWHGIVGEDTPFASALDFALWNFTLQVAWGLVYAVSPWQTSRYLMAKDEHVVIRAACIAAVFLMVMELTVYAAGAAINLSDTGIEPSEEVMIYAALNLLPEMLGALLLAGIMAAGLSSASTFLSLVGFSISNDLVPHENVDDRKMLALSRVTMFLIGVLILIIAFFSPVDIFWLTYFVGTLFRHRGGRWHLCVSGVGVSRPTRRSGESSAGLRSTSDPRVSNIWAGWSCRSGLTPYFSAHWSA